ncbi:hypothetical protein X566_18935 [Afipia sp. P52-10]|jgi:hypothetical protein|nr:hypothetical protein X566_18935 [Afipia sp. P52-10]
MIGAWTLLPRQEDVMTAASQALMLGIGVLVACFVAIYLLKFVEQMRGASAPSIERLTGVRSPTD